MKYLFPITILALTYFFGACNRNYHESVVVKLNQKDTVSFNVNAIHVAGFICGIKNNSSSDILFIPAIGTSEPRIIASGEKVKIREEHYSNVIYYKVEASPEVSTSDLVLDYYLF